MILITGGSFQGKRECAQQILGNDTLNETSNAEVIVTDGCSEEADAARSAVIWDHVTDYMRRKMEAGAAPEEVESEIEQVVQCNPGIILITRELGCGIVPVDPFDRRYREAHGRMCCRLAQKAERVYRVSCGLAQCIKGGN